ncbi:PAS domain-containing protein [Ramlibacter tataouinensis]|uniref:histidine kinase n=1 Tax=Ramlibacter tataouinensis (strain ATCC BAA-407 / DSM 14655 / LMG 21543 / TTB310) TaxID=365046 RepID=F5XW67_RAMTT|nr:PAS domain-containing protein [Ramlibacter tataouinensis]AEG91637.1 candidate histidine kinase, classic [Ramlibacter tataouinensis TTB310]
MQGRLSLSGRLMLLVLAAILPLVAQLVWSALRDAGNARLQAQEQLRLTATLVAAHQERLIDSAQHLLGAISAMPQIRSLDRKVCGEYLGQLRGRYPVYANIGLLDTRGDVICHAMGQPGSFNSADRDYFQRILAEPRFTVGSVVVGRASGRPVIPVGLPILDGERLLAIAFASLDLGRADDLLTQTDLPDGVRLVVVDRQATVLMEGPLRPDRAVGRRLNNQATRAAVQAMQPGVGEALDSAGNPRIYAFAPTRGVNGEKYLVIASVDAERVTGGAFAGLRKELLVVGASLLASLGLAAWLGRRFIVRPAGHIVDAARQLEQGRLDARVPTSAGTQRSELALIASSFNLMADSLQARQRELELELRRSQGAYELLDLVLNSMQEGVIACNMQGELIINNDAANQMFDLRGPHVPPEQWSSRFGLYHPDGATLFRTSQLPLAQAVQGRSGQLQMLVRSARQPQDRLIHCSYRPLGGPGEARGGLLVFSDVTELQRLQAEQVRQFERLRDAQRRLLEAQRIGRIGHWECDLNSGAMTWSDKVRELLNAASRGFDGSLPALLRRLHPDDRRPLRRLIEAPPSSGRLDLQLRLRQRRGRDVIWVHAIGEVVLDGGGRARLLGVAQDITGRKRSEAALLQSESELRGYTEMLQRSAVAARAISRQPTVERTVQEVERQACVVLGCAGARLVLVAGDDPLPPSLGGGARLSLRLAGRDGQVMGVLELWGHDADSFSERHGHVAAELAQFAAIAIDNARLLGQIRELNAGLEQRIAERTAELSRQEALARALAEQAPEVVWNADPEGRLTFVNRAWSDLVGGEPAQWLGHAWMSCIHPDDVPVIESNWRRSRETHEPYTGMRRVRARDGSWHTMSYRATLVTRPDGSPLFWVGVDSDVTALKAIEAALRNSNHELEAFSYSVSHDLRAPLGAIGGFSRAVAQKLSGHEDPKVQHYLARVQAGVERMEQLIEALLSLARVVREPMHWGPVDLGALAREVLEGLQLQEPERRVDAVVAEGLTAQGDARLLRIVLQNLVGNAWKFTAHADRACIEIGRLAQGDGDTFFVRDNGVGFDMAHAGKLFGPFQRLHTEAEFPGTGIGLATVQRVVLRHQGRVWVQSQPGLGTTFFFTLPLLPPALLPSGAG